MTPEPLIRRIRVIVNPKSGFGASIGVVVSAVEAAWQKTGAEITYELSHDQADSRKKIQLAIQDRVNLVLVAGGDGMINTVGRELMGTDVAMGVLPCGSGNGFARHFGIPIQADKAAEALFGGKIKAIDVGVINDHPFFVTCGLAWDAALVRSFERSPVRGILPYVFAGMYELFDYTPCRFRVRVDGGDWEEMEDPMVFTMANLTQFGGGARIAPSAKEDDGFLELVVVTRAHAAKAAAALPRLFAGTIDQAPFVNTRRFRSLEVRREIAGVIQLDGELMPATDQVRVQVRPEALRVLMPR